jgi:hypothetical protein
LGKLKALLAESLERFADIAVLLLDHLPQVTHLTRQAPHAPATKDEMVGLAEDKHQGQADDDSKEETRKLQLKHRPCQ